MAGAALTRLAALLAPPRCSGCAEACAADRWICGRCRELLRLADPPPSRGSTGAAFAYERPARELVLALKFGGAVALADELAALMLDRLGPQLDSADLIVPAPAHPQRLRRRGYNQSRLLADALAARCGAAVLDCLRRSGTRPPQSELGRRQRMALPADAITLRARALRPLSEILERRAQTNVVVCDDVTTTGSTLDACTRALRKQLPEAGPARLRAVVFAAA